MDKDLNPTQKSIPDLKLLNHLGYTQKEILELLMLKEFWNQNTGKPYIRRIARHLHKSPSVIHQSLHGRKFGANGALGVLNRFR